MAKKILVIDDEESICSLLSTFLGEKGYAPLIAKDGKEGLETAQRFVPDLILLDINMPGMDGFAVLEKLKHSEKTMHIPVVMLTARSDEVAKLKSWVLYAEYYVTKPFNLEELDARIKEILNITACGDGQRQNPKPDSTTGAA